MCVYEIFWWDSRAAKRFLPFTFRSTKHARFEVILLVVAVFTRARHWLYLEPDESPSYPDTLP
jgi:hypothetical protein